jgi:murein DD-endopeptidase MepM/ murein hydrolase activator NlpD
MGIKIDKARERLNKSSYRLLSLGLKGPNAGRRRPRVNYALNIFLMLVLVTAVTVSVKVANAKTVYAVKVDGSVIGYTEDETVHQDIVGRLLESESFIVGAEVVLDCEVTCEKVDKPPKGIVLSTGDELAEAIEDSVSYLAKGYVISVNGVDIVALSTEEEARGVISDLRSNYIAQISDSNQRVVEEVLIKENVDVNPKEVPSAMFRNREEAVAILTRGTDKVMNYVVKRGDSLWAIAEANDMTLSDILKANPTVNPDFIQIGQNLSLVVPDPYVTLASREVLTYTVGIPYDVSVSYDDSLWPWQETVIQAGKSGAKEVVQEITRENGKEVSRVTLSEKVISNPVTKKISRGSKQVPPMGSDDMVWPTQGSITSNFGWRWGRMHEGLDIGASTGTEILAADSGMVSFAGWNGGYGYLVKIDHGGGKETRYGHMSKIACKVGQTVTKGDVIGYVGSTGVSTGPHLHFEVRINGVAKNPLDYYK